MYRGSGPRILPLIIVIIVAVLIIGALVTVGRMVFGGNSDTTPQEETNTVATAVVDTTASRAVRWTVRGPIVANENYRTYQITVSPTERSYIVYSGYLLQPLETKTYSNNVAAYTQFVYALDNANVGKTRDVPESDLRGVCATDGLAYTFETLNGATADHDLWGSTCKDSPGSLAANPLQIQALFVNQIPDFKPLFTSVY